MQIVTISSKNQVTIPKRVLDQVGLDKAQSALMDTEEGTIRITPVSKSLVDQVAGSLGSYIKKGKRSASLKTIDRITREKTAQKLVST